MQSSMKQFDQMKQNKEIEKMINIKNKPINTAIEFICSIRAFKCQRNDIIWIHDIYVYMYMYDESIVV